MTTTSRLGAGAVAIALATSALVVPTATAAEGVAAIESGTVNWPIKESFNAYIGAAGELTVSDGVVRDGNSFNFTVDADDSNLDAEGNGTIELDGNIHYYAHNGGLDMTLDDFKVVVAGTDAIITADVELNGQRPGQEPISTEEDDVQVSSFELDEPLVPAYGETLTQSDLTTTFLDGAATLGYTPGEVVEGGDVDIELTFDNEPPAAPSGDESSDSSDSSQNVSSDDTEDSSSASDNAGIIAVIVAILAAVGAAGAAVAGLIPGVDVNSILSQFGL